MKIVVLLISTSLWLLAEGTPISFESFKQKALNEANIIKGAKLYTKKVEQESKLSSNFANPYIGASLNNRHEDDNGFDVGLSQAIRLPGFGSDLKSLNSAKVEASKASYMQTRAEFSKELESYYTHFVYQKSLETLLQREIELAKRIENIANNRLQNGAGTKASYLRAAIETKAIQNRVHSQKLYTKEYYFNLLSLASLGNEIEIEAKFIYKTEAVVDTNLSLNPNILKVKKEQMRLNKEIDAIDHTIKSIDLSVGYEKEPNDEILSVGLGVSLPIFSTTKEQVQLAKIKVNQNTLLLDQLLVKQKLKVGSLKSSLKTLNEQYIALLSLQSKQENLLKLYEEGYEISKGSLLELIDVKNSSLQTSRGLLDIQKEANLKKIELNYIQGTYNE